MGLPWAWLFPGRGTSFFAPKFLPKNVRGIFFIFQSLYQLEKIMIHALFHALLQAILHFMAVIIFRIDSNLFASPLSISNFFLRAKLFKTYRQFFINPTYKTYPHPWLPFKRSGNSIIFSYFRYCQRCNNMK